jgi:hypothetical protein
MKPNSKSDNLKTTECIFQDSSGDQPRQLYGSKFTQFL